MKSLTNIVGIALIILGILGLSYQNFYYTKHEKIAQFGEIQVTANTEHVVYIPPLLGGLSIGAGIILLIIGRIKK